MVSTADLAAVEDIATRHGAKILLTGDTEQLSAPEAAGAMRLLADEHGYYQLRTVQRFDQEWERAASLRLRAGDAGVLADYDQRGRILDGTREQMADAAYQRWLADHLSGKASLLLATTNSRPPSWPAGPETSSPRSAWSPPAISPSSRTATWPAPVTSSWPARTSASRPESPDGGWPTATCSASTRGTGRERNVPRVVRRVTGRGRAGEALWSAPFELPEDYIEQHADLAYAGNVHVAQGRTVDTAHLVVDETAGRESFYVGMSRGRQRNTAYVVTERVRAADISPEPRPAPGLEDPGTAAGRAAAAASARCPG